MGKETEGDRDRDRKKREDGGMRMDKKTRFVIMVSHAVSEVDFLSYYHSRWIYSVGITIGLRFS